jgi:hypothetical protein
VSWFELWADGRSPRMRRSYHNLGRASPQFHSSAKPRIAAERFRCLCYRWCSSWRIALFMWFRQARCRNERRHGPCFHRCSSIHRGNASKMDFSGATGPYKWDSVVVSSPGTWAKNSAECAVRRRRESSYPCHGFSPLNHFQTFVTVGRGRM